MKTAISTPDSIFEPAEKLAHRLGLSRSQLYTKAVKEYLEADKNDPITISLNEIYSKESSEPDRITQALQYSSLAKDEW
jgi:hypothetical protein